MAIHFETRTPKRLLRTYKEMIDKGEVKTWSYDDDGDFTHTAQQWIRQAWLRPKVIEQSRLTFFILAPSDTEMEVATYGVYHGRFVESMLSHCDKLFSSVSVSAQPEVGDVI